MTKRQRKNRKRINRLVELWPELFNREKPQPLKVEIPDDLITSVHIINQCGKFLPTECFQERRLRP
nr:ProQ/FINO family protein [Escherichia coli]